MVEARQDGGEPLRAGVLVIGGGFAGVGAALAARRSGASVVLIEPRTYLGEELTATLRPWLPRDLAERLEDRLGALGVVAGAGAEVELVPDRLKTALEDRLLEAGVTLRYAARPVGWKGDGVFTVEFAGKAGAFDVVAEAVVDATAQGSVARWLPSCAPRWRAGQALRLWRTLEFKIVDRVALAAGGTGLVVPAALSPAARWHAGHDPHGHVLVEFAVDAPFSPDPGWLGPADLESRGRDLDLAAWLIGNHPAFAGARLAAVAPEPLAPPLWRVGAAGDGPLGAHRPLPGLWVASVTADLDDADAAALAADPAALLDLGDRLGASAAGDRELAASGWHRPPVLRRQVDVLVVGGGSSGVPAAIAAGRQGASVLLVEMGHALGGTGTLGGVDSYWFGRRGGFNAEVSAAVAREHGRLRWPAGAKWNVPG